MIEELETDTGYLHSPKVSHFDSAPWAISGNPFVRRMALNLKTGVTLSAITPETLEAVLGTSARLCNQSVTVDIESLSGEQAGLLNATVEGIFNHFIIPTSAGYPANFKLALEETATKRSCFMASVTPDSKFWIHSEFASPNQEPDWSESLLQRPGDLYS